MQEGALRGRWSHAVGTGGLRERLAQLLSFTDEGTEGPGARSLLRGPWSQEPPQGHPVTGQLLLPRAVLGWAPGDS